MSKDSLIRHSINNTFDVWSLKEINKGGANIRRYLKKSTVRRIRRTNKIDLRNEV